MEKEFEENSDRLKKKMYGGKNQRNNQDQSYNVQGNMRGGMSNYQGHAYPNYNYNQPFTHSPGGHVGKQMYAPYRNDDGLE